ncbi:MAG: DUF370 domain-containing protein [Defluviitaleaceae bacterium]|nr:DUF370 domain-containing protein [Defluviitaleaceae bacterium]
MTTVKVLNVGFGNMVFTDRIVSIVSPEAAPVKRIITDARSGGNLVDATCGRRTRAVIVTDSGHVVLSSLLPETLAGRAVHKELPPDDEQDG